LALRTLEILPFSCLLFRCAISGRLQSTLVFDINNSFT
jgi:hypothetical protein